MGELVIAIILSGILNLGAAAVPVVATCLVMPSENDLAIQGDIRCKVVVGGNIGLGITGFVYPLIPTLPGENKQDYVYY